MGNGCEWLTGRSSESSLPWVRVLGAAFILLLAACVALGLGSRRYDQKSVAQASAFPNPTALGKSTSKSKPDARAILGQLPLIFEPNQGQAESGVKFLAHGSGYSLYLDPTGAVLSMQTARPAPSGQKGTTRSVESVRMTLVGANPTVAVAGSDRLPGTTNYFIGNDPKQWRTGIAQFAGVHYRSVYPGIDLVFYGSQGHLEYDFKVAPGADPSQAELQFDGASKLELRGGDLILTGTGAGVRLQAPRVYQRFGDRQQPVEGRFVLRAANRVGFEIGPYDRGRELVIDPTINYSTYFGGGTESYPSIAVNTDGSIYLAGSTAFPNLPIKNAYQSTLNGVQNIFILQLNPNAGANGILYLTYLGGSGIDTNAGLAVDTAGNVFVAGTTTSPNFPTVSGFQSVPKAGSTGAPCFANESVPCHVFVSRLSGFDSTSIPALTYSTYLSGSGTDIASGLATDGNGDAFVTGTTTSVNPSDVGSGFPSTAQPVPYQLNPSPNSTIQFFVTEVDTSIPGTASVPYSTYFGGNNGTIATGGGIVVDTVGNIYFSGTTNFYNSGIGTNGAGGLQTGDFPILNAYQPCLNTPPPTVVLPPVTCPAVTSPELTDGFVAKLNPANAQTGGLQLLFSTYFGGSGTDSSTGLTIDSTAASIYITGSTNTGSTPGSAGNFVIPTGTAAFQSCLDTPPPNPVPCPAITATPVPTDAYVAKFTNPTETTGSSSNAVALSYFSYLGGSGNDSGLAIAVDTASGALVTGETSSGIINVPSPTTGFPVTASALQTVLRGTQNAFFAHLDTTIVSGQSSTGSYSTYFGGDGVDRGTSITVDPNLNTYFAGDTTSDNLEVFAPLQPNLAPPMNAFAVRMQPAFDLNMTSFAISPPSTVASAGTQVTVAFTLTNEGSDVATNVTVQGLVSGGSTPTFNTASVSASTGSVCSLPSGDNAACLIPTLQSGGIATITFAVTPTQKGSGTLTATASAVGNTGINNSLTATFTATNFSASVTPFSQTVVAGNTATYSVQVAPFTTFGSNVSLSCSSLPVGASCGFTPSSLVFTGPGALSSTLNLTTTPRPITTISSTKWRGSIYALWLMAPGMALIGLGGKKRRRNRLLGLLVLAMLFAFIVPLPACSSAKQQPVVSGTPAGTYPLTVTAISGSYTVSAPFSLTVQ
ncbi:MAG: SBBP repeat-containing protein [Candidatus Sulfotelmatobacter sp.]